MLFAFGFDSTTQRLWYFGEMERHVFAFGPPLHTCQLCVHNMSRQIKN